MPNYQDSLNLTPPSIGFKAELGDNGWNMNYYAPFRPFFFVPFANGVSGITVTASLTGASVSAYQPYWSHPVQPDDYEVHCGDVPPYAYRTYDYTSTGSKIYSSQNQQYLNETYNLVIHTENEYQYTTSSAGLSVNNVIIVNTQTGSGAQFQAELDYNYTVDSYSSTKSIEDINPVYTLIATNVEDIALSDPLSTGNINTWVDEILNARSIDSNYNSFQNGVLELSYLSDSSDFHGYSRSKVRFRVNLGNYLSGYGTNIDEDTSTINGTFKAQIRMIRRRNKIAAITGRTASSFGGSKQAISFANGFYQEVLSEECTGILVEQDTREEFFATYDNFQSGLDAFPNHSYTIKHDLMNGAKPYYSPRASRDLVSYDNYYTNSPSFGGFYRYHDIFAANIVMRPKDGMIYRITLTLVTTDPDTYQEVIETFTETIDETTLKATWLLSKDYPIDSDEYNLYISLLELRVVDNTGNITWQEIPEPNEQISQSLNDSKVLLVESKSVANNSFGFKGGNINLVPRTRYRVKTDTAALTTLIADPQNIPDPNCGENGYPTGSYNQVNVSTYNEFNTGYTTETITCSRTAGGKTDRNLYSYSSSNKSSNFLNNPYLFITDVSAPDFVSDTTYRKEWSGNESNEVYSGVKYDGGGDAYEMTIIEEELIQDVDVIYENGGNWTDWIEVPVPASGSHWQYGGIRPVPD